MKDGGLRRALGVGVVILQRAKERQIRIAAKCAAIGAFVNCAEARNELVVNQIKLPAGIDDLFIGQIIQLRAQNFADGAANLDQSANSARRFVRQIENWRQRAPVRIAIRAIVQREGVFLHVIRRDHRFARFGGS